MSATFVRRVLLPIVIVAAGILLFFVLFKLRPEPPRQQPAMARPVVSVHTVATESQPIHVSGFGTVEAKRSVTLVPQVSGEIVAKSEDFWPGGYFTRGEVLLRIDDTDYVLAVARAKADVAQAEYNLARAEEEAQVARREWERIGADNAGDRDAPTALVLHEPQLKLAQATLEAARATQRQAEVNLGRCTVSAPFDGRVLATTVAVGQYLRAGNAIGEIYATDVAEITVSVPDEDLAWIQVDGKVGGSDPANLVDVSAEFAGTRHHWRGRAVRLGGAVDARSRLVPVVVEVDDPYVTSDGRPPLVEGMFVEIVFSGEPPAGSLTIPRAALRPGNTVWLVDDADLLHIRDVQVARAGVDEAVITGGLAGGERLVTSNLQFVTEGLPVRLDSETARATAAGTATGGGKDGAR